MLLINSTTSPKFPFRDKFQSNIERNTRQFIQSKYGTFGKINTSAYQRDMDTLEGIITTPSQKSRLIRVELRTRGGEEVDPKVSIEVYPPEIIAQFREKSGDQRIEKGIISPLFECLKWAERNGINLPTDLNADIYFWIADKPSWEIDNLPVFLPSAIPPNMNLPLFPDISYFHYQPFVKYSGQGFNWDQLKKLFAGPNDELRDVIFFKGVNTTKFNSNIRMEVSKNLGMYVPRENLDITVFDMKTATSAFKPIQFEGKGKRVLLDMPGKFPWSIRLKMLFLFEGSPTVIKLGERWVASDGTWADPEEHWVQWIDGFLPKSAYLSLMHTYIESSKANARDKKRAEDLNKKAVDKTLREVANLYEKAEAPDSALGHKIVTELSSDRINQYLFRLVLTMGNLRKKAIVSLRKEEKMREREDEKR